MDANVGAAIGSKGSSLEATTASLTAPRTSYDTYSYTVSKGAMIDVSWKGNHCVSPAPVNALRRDASSCTTGCHDFCVLL